jgi:DNA-binding GntR family transcriptional regulator
MTAWALKHVQRIADELAARIISGELAPGVRVPSADELVTTYKLAPTQAHWIWRQLSRRRLIRLNPFEGLVVGNPGEEWVSFYPARMEERITAVFDHLAARIRDGEIAVHERVGTQRQLIARYQVSDEVATAARHRLEYQGWAYSIPYRGTFGAPCDDWPIHRPEPIPANTNRRQGNRLAEHRRPGVSRVLA